MSSSTADMINQLQAQLAVPAQPSFGGVAAPPNADAIRGLLAQLKQQQYQEQANAPTGGQYGYLHDAGKQAFNSVGEQLGAALGGAINGPAPATPAGPAFTMPATDSGQAPASGAAANGPPIPVPNPGSTPQQSINNAVMAAKAYNATLIKSGMSADAAKVETLKQMVAWQVPGADDELVKAQADAGKNAATAAETKKNNSQAAMDDSDITKNAIENKSKQYTVTYKDPNGLFEIQTDANGKQERVELKPPPSAQAQMAANLDPNSFLFCVV